jgi:hypothetical protein
VCDPYRKFTALCMSEDHKPTREDEAKRIRDAGGFVINNRVMGELAVSRAFGDVDFKKGLQVRGNGGGDCCGDRACAMLSYPPGLDLLSYSTKDPLLSVVCWAHFFTMHATVRAVSAGCSPSVCDPHLYRVLLRRRAGSVARATMAPTLPGRARTTPTWRAETPAHAASGPQTRAIRATGTSRSSWPSQMSRCAKVL